MSDIFKVSTSGLVTTKKADIDGVVFTVRRKGGGDGLDISLRATKISNVAKEFVTEHAKLTQAKDDEERINILARVEKIVAKMSQLQDELENCYVALFDDGGDQSKSKALVRQYGVDGIENILNQIFGDKEDGDGK